MYRPPKPLPSIRMLVLLFILLLERQASALQRQLSEPARIFHPALEKWNITVSVSNKEGVRGDEMPNFSSRSAKLVLVGRRHWIFEAEPFSGVANKTFESSLNDVRLKKHLRRAVNRLVAPQSLIDSIRSGLRG